MGFSAQVIFDITGLAFWRQGRNGGESDCLFDCKCHRNSESSTTTPDYMLLLLSGKLYLRRFAVESSRPVICFADRIQSCPCSFSGTARSGCIISLE